MNPKIIFLGSGNLATNLALAINKSGFIIKQVYSRRIENAKMLAEKVNASYTDKIELTEKADLYILALSDDFLKEIVLNSIFKEIVSNSIVVHTAGSVNVDILKTLSENYGVFYPLQTFSKEINVNFNEIPVFIEYSNEDVRETLNGIANTLSNRVKEINSEQRKYIHLAAVFTCNFTNYLLSVSEEILNEKNIDVSVLHPLLKETFRKAITNSPSDIQTGPARRNDTQTINNHLEALKLFPKFREIYKVLSEGIITKYNQEG